MNRHFNMAPKKALPAKKSTLSRCGPMAQKPGKKTPFPMCGTPFIEKEIGICGTPFIEQERAQEDKKVDRNTDDDTIGCPRSPPNIIHVLTDSGCFPIEDYPVPENIRVNAATTTRGGRVVKKPVKYGDEFPLKVTKSKPSKPKKKAPKEDRSVLTARKIPSVPQDDDANQGGCLCGQVRYQFRGTEPVKLCHCTDCQKWSGGAFTSNIVINRETFELLRSTDRTKIGFYRTNSRYGNQLENRRFFCKSCGSSLWAWMERFATRIIVKAGSCDDQGTREGCVGGHVNVDHEFFTRDRMRYVTGIQVATQHHTDA